MRDSRRIWHGGRIGLNGFGLCNRKSLFFVLELIRLCSLPTVTSDKKETEQNDDW